GYNYRGFDIGNHFCEYAGFDFEFEKLYPGPEARETFLRYYMDAMAPPWFNTKPKEWQQAFCAEFSAVVNELA
ncbi:EMB1187, partial [Symbiodinium sp. KB8]